MKPKDVLLQWIEAFNNADVDAITNLYDDNAVNHQVAKARPSAGNRLSGKCFRMNLAPPKWSVSSKTYIEDGEWAILEWRDPLGLRGCGFFHILNDKIVFQRGYWDKLSFLKQRKEL